MSYQLEHKDSTSIQTHGGYLKYRLYPLLCNTPETGYQCSDHIYTPSLTPLITSLPLLPVELPKTTHLPPLGKEYLCFRVDNKSPHAAQCVKSRVLNKAIDYILSINIFEQQCVVIKCILQSSSLEDHMKTVGIDQS